MIFASGTKIVAKERSFCLLRYPTARTHTPCIADFARRREIPNRDTFPTPLPDNAYSDNWIAENGLRLLESFPTGRPWHLVVNFTGSHDPWDVTMAMQERMRDVAFPPPHANDQWDAATHQQIRRNYVAMIENIDRHVGRFLNVVRTRGEEHRTLVIYSSDHGEMLGDHNQWGKSTPYEQSVGIPLIVAGPNVRAHRVSDALVSLHDLTATMLDYADADPLPDMESRSLRLLLAASREDHRAYAVSALNDWRMISDERYKLILTDGAAPIVFDRATDPKEDRNIAAQAPSVVDRLRYALARETIE
ncbi:MAG: sulfatase family protein [Thermomicrobiales bacterium]